MKRQTCRKDYLSRSIYLKAIIVVCLVLPTFELSMKMTMDNTSIDSTISSYYTDLGSCACDIHASICDNFCCCDSACSQTQISTWTGSKLCKNSKKTLQMQCQTLSEGGFMSFEDLACVYYSNRGNIGYFYQYPEAGGSVYPTPAKFVAQAAAAQSIDLVSSAAGVDSYSSSEYLLKMNKDGSLKYLELWAPLAGGDCGVGFANISKSSSYACEYSLISASCSKSTDLLKGTVLLCKNGNCNQTSPLVTVPVSTAAGNICNNFITNQVIDIKVSSLGSNYIIDSITVTLTQASVDFSVVKKYPVQTRINIAKSASAVQYSGNPGYLMGKNILMENSNAAFSLSNIADASGNCAVSATSSVPILFGQNEVYSCISSNPCASNLIVDSLAKQSNLKIFKWAKGSNDTVLVGGTGSAVNTCSTQMIVLNIVYSSAGWQLDLQNYIIGAQITLKPAVQTSWNKKYLKINWIYVDPSEITASPDNSFYTYFSYIWTPLRQYFGVY